jgi:hypothetical protein
MKKSISEMIYMEIEKIENDQKMKQQKPRKNNLKAKTDFPYKMGSW